MLFRVLADETVPVGHLHLGQRVRVHHVVFADDLVEREDVSGQCVDFIVGERLWLLQGIARRVKSKMVVA